VSLLEIRKVDMMDHGCPTLAQWLEQVLESCDAILSSHVAVIHDSGTSRAVTRL